nr:AraC family transcriptional regulator [Phytoactinopolyspora mesophila]
MIAVRKARDLIDRSYAESLSLDQIAQAAGYSRFHLIRAFRAAFGETPGRYLTRRRVERAQDLLRSANLTVTEVCHLVGFSSLGSFSTRFHQIVGTSPVQFQRTARASGGLPVPGCYVFMWGAPSIPGENPPARQSPSRAGSKTATTEKPDSLPGE